MRKERKRIMFRVDSSTTIGSGHVMRCLTLAAELRKIGAETEFICRELPGNLSGLIRQHGHFVHLLPRSERTNRSSDWCSHATWLEVPWKQDANECLLVMKQGSSCEWLVVDHYALNQNWEQTLRPHVEKIMIIDDLADRVHDCDLLLDQNLYSEEGRYDGLLPIECLTLLGPKFALLRPEFKEMRAQLKKRTGKINRILVFFGGVDASNETARVIKIIRSLPQKNVFLDVVVGAANQHRMEIEQLCLEMPLVNYHCQVCNMAELLAAADLAIGAGGGTCWERCALKLPSIIISLAENQIRIAENLSKVGAIQYLGEYQQVTFDDIINALKMFFSSPGKLKEMAERAGSLVDTHGVRRVINFMEQI